MDPMPSGRTILAAGPLALQICKTTLRKKVEVPNLSDGPPCPAEKREKLNRRDAEARRWPAPSSIPETIGRIETERCTPCQAERGGAKAPNRWTEIGLPGSAVDLQNTKFNPIAFCV